MLKAVCLACVAAMGPKTATTANKEIAKSYLFNIFAGNKITRKRALAHEHGRQQAATNIKFTIPERHPLSIQ